MTLCSDYKPSGTTSFVQNESGSTSQAKLTKTGIDRLKKPKLRSARKSKTSKSISTAQMQERYATWSREGYRVLAVATRTVPEQPAYRRDDERGLVLAGFLLCFDPPDPQSRRTLADLAQLGVAVKILTGDNRYIAAHLADAVGLDGGALLTGEQIDAMHDEALWAVAAGTRVFAEVDPNLCLLEQGLPCCGPAARDGCGAKCPAAGAPCIGCYGATQGVNDFGARLLSAYASVVDASEPEDIERILAGLPDTVGQFYRFSLAASLLHGGRS